MPSGSRLRSIQARERRLISRIAISTDTLLRDHFGYGRNLATLDTPCPISKSHTIFALLELAHFTSTIELVNIFDHGSTNQELDRINILRLSAALFWIR